MQMVAVANPVEVDIAITSDEDIQNPVEVGIAITSDEAIQAEAMRRNLGSNIMGQILEQMLAPTTEADAPVQKSLLSSLMERCLQKLAADGNDMDMIALKQQLVRARVIRPILLEVAHEAAQQGNPTVLLDLAKEGDLAAVDLLHEVAESNNEQAHVALCAELDRIIDTHPDAIRHALYVLCWKDRQPAFELLITLLQTMARVQHQNAVTILGKVHVDVNGALAQGPPDLHQIGIFFRNKKTPEQKESSWRKANDEYLDVRDNKPREFSEQVNLDAWRNQHAMLPLQILAKEGHEHAVQALVSDADVLYRDGFTALTSLAQQWNRQALKEVKKIDAGELPANNNEENQRVVRRKARSLLEKLEDSLRRGW